MTASSNRRAKLNRRPIPTHRHLRKKLVQPARYVPCFHDVYEETLHVPLIISWPGCFQEGVTCESLAESIDIYPTLIELTALSRPVDAPALPGRSLVPSLTDGEPTGRTCAVSEKWSQVTVITNRYKLGVWIDPTARYAQRDFCQFPDILFDRQTDPQELVNLIGKPEMMAIEKQLREHLDEWIHNTPDEGKQARVSGRNRAPANK